MCPQTNIAFNANPGQPGMAFDAESSNRDVVSIVAAQNIPFGVYCELNASGAAIPLQDATTAGAFAAGAKTIGVCLLDPLGVEQNYQTFTVPNVGTGSTASGYLKGQSVPFMRKGRIWVLTDATGTFITYGPVNVNHSSTGAFSQGVFTFSAVSATVGHEIDIAPSCITWNPNLLGGTTGPTFTDAFGNVFNMLCVEINL